MKREAGQAILIVLLSMSVVLTVVLSIIAASTSDIKIGTDESQSIRALSAAESGVQESLVTNSASTGNLNGGASFTSNVTSLAAGATAFIYPTNIYPQDSAIFWLVSHSDSGITVCDANNPCYTGRYFNILWGNPNDATTDANSSTAPALEVTVYYLATPGDYSTARVAKNIYDPNTTRRLTNFYNGSGTTYPCPCTIGTTSFKYLEGFDLNATFNSTYSASNGPQFITVKMLYNNNAQPIAIQTDTALPAQGFTVDSTGTVDSSTRKVQVEKAYGGIPSIFDAAIFSPNSLTK